jgi:hypothetical protein
VREGEESEVMAPFTPDRIVDLRRYPIDDLGSAGARQVVARARTSLAEKGVAILAGFVTADALAAMSAEADRLEPRAYLENVWGTPYLGLPDERFPDGHPRRTTVHSLTSVIAYDLIEADSALRTLYEWDGLLAFVSEVLDRRPLFRMGDPLGALNMTVMREGHVQGWHYDNADFVVSLAVQASERGGLFECARAIRSEDDERYDEVARVLAGTAGGRVEVYPMVPGTLMIFAGRRSLHRVSPVAGPVPRKVGLLAYDVAPGVDTSDLFKLIRYGRTASTPPPAAAAV